MHLPKRLCSGLAHKKLVDSACGLEVSVHKSGGKAFETSRIFALSAGSDLGILGKVIRIRDDLMMILYAQHSKMLARASLSTIRHKLVLSVFLPVFSC